MGRLGVKLRQRRVPRTSLPIFHGGRRYKARLDDQGFATKRF